jgi:hypothetical protein
MVMARALDMLLTNDERVYGDITGVCIFTCKQDLLVDDV